MLFNIVSKRSFGYFSTPVKKVLICPDKFKFSLTSQQVSDIVRNSLPYNVQSKVITLADGGDGSLDSIASQLQGKWVSCQVEDPLFRTVEAKYFQTEEKEAYIEMARASGLSFL